MADLKWNGPALQARLAAEMGKRLDAAAIVVEGHAKTLLSVDGTAKSAPGRDKRGKFTRGKLVYGANPSKPGEPPHVQTGRLRASVAHEREGMVARVGTNVKYGRSLELGTVRVAARPWLRRALIEMTGAVRAIVGRPID